MTLGKPKLISSGPPSCNNTQENPLCRYFRSLKLQRTSLEENTLLGLKSLPVSLSFACLELDVFGILVVTTLRRFDLTVTTWKSN